ncbi:MAG: hypothetical protein ABEJ60_01615 [Halodesulfurarchaeum sp.]
MGDSSSPTEDDETDVDTEEWDPEVPGREESGETAEDLPPGARDEEEAKYEDQSDEARETANPDQHRDEEAYD